MGKISIGQVVGLLLSSAACTVPVAMASDPFATDKRVAASPAATLAGPATTPVCEDGPPPQTPLTLAQVVERALCSNPQTRVAWANARVQAAQLGVSRAADLPTLNATAAMSQNRASALGAVGGVAGSYRQQSVGLSLDYLLYDFGARSAAVENASQVLAAANAAQDAAIQSVFLAAVQAYYQRFAAQAAVEATVEAEKSAAEGLKAATVRYQVGTGTPADKLQAQTAYSQAVLNRIQAQGNVQTAQGTLANVLGLDANVPVRIAPPTAQTPAEHFEQDVARLIDEARRNRPDLAEAEAQIRAAQASVKAEKAAGLPSLTVGAGANYNDTSVSDPFHTSSLSLSLSVPLFTGFSTTYRVRAAQAQVTARSAQRDQLSQQIALDVWNAYQTLITDTHALQSSADLLASATESERVAMGRYKAGAGSILDVVTAQSALAAARQQRVQALYGWYIAKAALAQSMGQLNLSGLATSPPSEQPVHSPESSP